MREEGCYVLMRSIVYRNYSFQQFSVTAVQMKGAIDTLVFHSACGNRFSEKIRAERLVALTSAANATN